MDDVIETLEGVHINDLAATGLTDDDQRNYLHGDPGSDGDNDADDDDIDLPSVIIVTGVPDAVFDTDDGRSQFEAIFTEFETTAQFHYLRSFRRARVVYSTIEAATAARVYVNERSLCDSTIKCYFAQPVQSEFKISSAPYLLPPKPERQFLISPPSSPPVGWEPCAEQEPVISLDLLAALSNLTPGEAHELHPRTESLPGIVVHVCEDPEGFKERPAILQTMRPDFA